MRIRKTRLHSARGTRINVSRDVRKGERKRGRAVYLKQRISKRCHTRSRGCSCDKGSTDTRSDVVGEARQADDTRLDSLTT